LTLPIGRDRAYCYCDVHDRPGAEVVRIVVELRTAIL
jgi:hypothetical protein